MSANETHAIGPQAKLASIGDDPYFRRLLSLAYKNGAIADELTACVNAWHHRQLEHYRRSPPGVGLSNDRLLDLAAQASLWADNDALISYARSVLSAASHHTPNLSAEEKAFVELVRQRPGHKLNSGEARGADGTDLWVRPQALGLIQAVGSYKWVVPGAKAENPVASAVDAVQHAVGPGYDLVKRGHRVFGAVSDGAILPPDFRPGSGSNEGKDQA